MFRKLKIQRFPSIKKNEDKNSKNYDIKKLDMNKEK
jgi:hypothetical protein